MLEAQGRLFPQNSGRRIVVDLVFAEHIVHRRQSHSKGLDASALGCCHQYRKLVHVGWCKNILFGGKIEIESRNLDLCKGRYKRSLFSKRSRSSISVIRGVSCISVIFKFFQSAKSAKSAKSAESLGRIASFQTAFRLVLLSASQNRACFHLFSYRRLLAKDAPGPVC